MKSTSPRHLFFILLLTLAGIGLTAQDVHASHLRGQTLSWAPTGTLGEVEFTFNYSERYTASFPTLGSTFSVSISFGDGATGIASGPVTSINTTDDYFIAVLKVRHTYAGVGPYTAFYNNCCRISTIKDGHDQTIQLQTTVTPRNGNRSPVASLPVVVTVATTGTVQFTLPASDIDGDRLHFRLATSLESFATSTPGFLTQPPGLSVDPNTGVVTWNTSLVIPAPVAGDLWTSQIMVEDLDSLGNVKSKVPVDFILKFVAATGHAPTITLNPAGPITASPNNLVTFTVTGNDVDANSRVTLNASGMPSGASMSPALGATLSPPVTSTFSWTPTLAQAGTTGQTYVINFTATDDTNQQALVSITINVLPAGAPTANSQSATATTGVPQVITLSATDPNGSNLTFSITGSPAQGTITNIGSPSCSLSGGVSTCTENVTYTSNNTYSGPDSFSFRASNGVQNSNAATVSITVNKAATALTVSPATGFDNGTTSFTATLLRTSVPAGPLSGVAISFTRNGTAVGSATTDTNGIATLNNVSLVATIVGTYPAGVGASFAGNSAYLPSSGSATLTVQASNRPPAAANDNYSVTGDLSLNVAAPGVLSNDTDADGNSLTAVLDSSPAHGTLTLNANGSFAYTPNTGYVGGDSFAYHASDGSANSNIGMVAITVTAPACVPHPTDLVAWFPGNGNANDVMGGNNGTLQGGATFGAGKVNQAFSLDGLDDRIQLGNPASLQLQDFTIDAWIKRSSSSVATNNSGGFDIGNIVSYGANGYALVIDGPTGHIGLSKVTVSGVFGTSSILDTNYHHVAVTKSGTQVYLYVDGVQQGPFTYNDTFTFATNLAFGGRGDGDARNGFFGSIDEVEIFNRALDATEVANLYNASSAGKCNAAPIAQDQSVTTDEDTPLNISLNATDNDGNLLTYTVVDNPANGALSGTAPHLNYTPNANYNGADSFTFKVNDGFVDSNTATVSITVNPVNDAPVAVCTNLTFTTSLGNPKSMGMGGSCSINVNPGQFDNGSSDVDGDALTYTVSPSGPFTVGTTPVTLTVTDPSGASSSCTASITVIDDTAPVPDVARLTDATGECAVTVTPPTATDNCGGTIHGTTTDPLTYSEQGTYTINWAYDDGHGNVSNQPQQVIVKDTTAPVVPNLPGSPQTFNWVHVKTPGSIPGPRSGHGMVYDPVHAKVIMFGGQNDLGTYLNDIWELDSASNTWTNVTPASGGMPSPRASFGMAYDVSSAKVLIYGGQVTVLGPGIAADTWEWDPASHTWGVKSGALLPGGPRLGSGLAYDPNLHKVILFGGRNFSGFGNTLTGTYAWDGTTWQQLSTPVGPIGRYTQGMATDFARSKVVMFGGYNGNLLGDTWEWNGINWTLVAPNGSGPFMRSGPGLAYDSGRQRTVMFGGSTGQPAADTWEWNGTTWTQQQTQANPSARGTGMVVFDSAQSKLVIFSGDGQTADTWYSHTTSGLPTITGECSATVTAPTATDNCAGPITGTTTDPTTYNAQGTYTVHWTYNDGNGNSSTQTQTVIVKDTTPPAISCPAPLSASADSSCQAAIPNVMPNVTASDNCTAPGSIIITQSPAAGTMVGLGPHTITVTATDGVNNSSACTTTFTVSDTTPPVVPNLPGSPQSFNWVNVNTPGSTPAPRTGHRMVYDPVRHKVILFGGHDPAVHPSGNYVLTSHLNDVWELDTATNIWTNVTPTSGPMPVARADFGMAYDVARDKVVIYGGEVDGWLTGDTWEWDPANRTWAAKPAASSLVFGGLLGSAMAYDPNRHQVILFGGRAYYNWGEATTWAWDGNNWSALPTSIYPPARFVHGMATDFARSKVVMFGGENNSSPLTDTWEWDGSAWAQVAVSGPAPPARDKPAMAYDAARQVTVLFGGDNVFGPGSERNDTWSWNGTAWSLEHPPTSPSPRATSLAYDESQSKLVLFSGDAPADTWNSQTTSGLPTITAECSAMVTAPVATDNCSGPITGTTSDPTSYNSQGTYTIHWSYDDHHGNISTQTQTVIVKDTTAPVPDAPSLADLTGECSITLPPAPTATDNCDGRLVGVPDKTGPFGQGDDTITWTFTDHAGNRSTQTQAVHVHDTTAPQINGLGTNYSWFNVNVSGPKPSARVGHQMVYDSARHKVILFGGQTTEGSLFGGETLPSNSDLLNDMWEWDGSTRTWTEVQPASGPIPSPRSFFGMAYDPVRAKVVVYGGKTDAIYYSTSDDTWEWDPASRVWTAFPSAGSITYGGLRGLQLAYDSNLHKAILFGGIMYWGGHNGQTWSWDGAQWSLRSSAGPSGRIGHAMATDFTRSKVVLFGGYDYTGNDYAGLFDPDTWEWNGSSWTQVATSGPGIRIGVAMAVDTARGVAVLFGGTLAGNANAAPVFNDTWEWNGTAWSQRTMPTSPAPRDTVLAFDGSTIMMFGGRQGAGTALGDTWVIQRSGSADITVDNDRDHCSAVVNFPTPTATDACGAVTVATNPTSGSVFPVGVTPVTVTATDINGNRSTQTFNVTVRDAQSPTPDNASLADVVAECSADLPAAPTATDNCEGRIVGVPDKTGPFGQGDDTITWTFTDHAGNRSTQTQAVHVHDTTAPVPDAPSLPDATGECSASISSKPTATDACAGAISGTTTDPLSYSNQGTYVVTWHFDDGKGNVSTQTQNVIVKDSTPPTPPALPAVTGECSASVTAPTAQDNCVGPVTGTTTDPTSYGDQGTYTVTWHFNDGHGNESTAAQTVIVKDTIAPVPDLSSLATVTGECSASVAAPTATDNCAGRIVGTTNDQTSYSAQGTYTIHWSYDDGHGNTSTQTQQVIVKDVTKPVPVLAALPDVTGECSAIIESAPKANDNCAGSITGTTNDPLTYTEQGTFTVTWHFNDGNGNESIQTQKVIVKDNTPPVLNVPADVNATTGLGATSCSTIVSDAIIGSASATDNCGVQSVVRSGVPAGSVFPVGTTTITYIATDIHGKTTSGKQLVTVVDNTKPQLNVPVNVSIPTAADATSCTAFVNNNLLTPSATDNCGIDPNSFTRSGVPAGNNFPVGTTIVTYTVKDIYGNLSTGTQTVTVTDATLPVITLNGKTITLWPPDHQYVTIKIADLVASATDNCDTNVTLSKVVISQVTSDEPENINSGDGNTLNDIVIALDCKSVDLRAERDGSKNGRVYWIYFQVKDSTGNLQTAKAKVTVPKSQGANGAAVDDTPPAPAAPPYKVVGSCPP